jgi:PAS domain S-box-containing protein
MPKDLSPRSLAIALAIMAAAIALRAALDPLLPGLPPFATLYPAMALAGLLCGAWAGAAASLLGAAAAAFLWLPPHFTLAISSTTDRVSMALFVLSSGIVLWAADNLRAQLSACALAKHGLDLGLASGGVGTWDINLRSLRITASPAAYTLHFMPETTATTEPEDWLRGVHPDDVATIRATLQDAVTNGTLAAYTYRIAGPGGEPRWITARGRVVTTAGQRRLLCALMDITDQVRMQDELISERQRLRLALEAGSLAVWDYHPVTRDLSIDPRYATTMGFDPDVKILTRRQIAERLHPEDRLRVAAEHEAIVASDADYHIEYRVVRPDGDTRWLVSHGIRISNDSLSEPGRMVGIIQDITELKQREATLRDIAAARELLVREADHRIKNSLQLVSSLLTVQLRGVEDPAAQDALRGAIARVGAIAASHLALQDSKNLTDLDLAITLRDICTHFAQLHPAITILCHPSPSLMLDADRAIPLGLVVSEVLTNALRHAFPGRDSGTVIVDASQTETHLTIRVTDNGAGMSPNAQGSGLGSRIIRSLASQLAATIQTDSTPHTGTTVTLRLPLTQETIPQRATA